MSEKESRPLFIYLDHAAGTPPYPAVAETVGRVLAEFSGNPSGTHRGARRAAAILDAAREQIAAATGATPAGVIFTSGGTEADNLAIKGIAFAVRNRLGLKKVVVSAIEHKAVLESARWLQSQGFEVLQVPVLSDGTLDLDAFYSALDPSTALVSIMTANNETGAVQPFPKISEIVRERAPRAVLHTDACQAFSATDVGLDSLQVDALSLSAQKFGGPQGVGALVISEGVPLLPLQHGGSQELGRRAGTQNVAGIAGMGVAVSITLQHREEFGARIAPMRDRLEKVLSEAWEGARVNASDAPRLPHISNIAFPGARSEDLLVLLDRKGIAASAGSSCASGSLTPSHVLLAMGLDELVARCAVRFSLGHTTTPEDIEAATEAVMECLDRLWQVRLQELHSRR